MLSKMECKRMLGIFLLMLSRNHLYQSSRIGKNSEQCQMPLKETMVQKVSFAWIKKVGLVSWRFRFSVWAFSLHLWKSSNSQIITDLPFIRFRLTAISHRCRSYVRIIWISVSKQWSYSSVSRANLWDVLDLCKNTKFLNESLSVSFTSPK